jgi:hypothetical protein
MTPSFFTLLLPLLTYFTGLFKNAQLQGAQGLGREAYIYVR